MLPGVEVARKRRIHHHVSQQRGPQDHVPYLRGPVSSSMGEPALAARIRLEEKLRGSDGFGAASVAPSNSSSRWTQFMRDRANISRQQNTKTSRNNTKEEVINQVEATPKSSDSNGCW